MAEDDTTTTSNSSVEATATIDHMTSGPPHMRANDDVGLGASDIETNVYEGGFKSWEGAMDLARLLLERGPRKDIDDLARVDGVVEVRSVFWLQRTFRTQLVWPLHHRLF